MFQSALPATQRTGLQCQRDIQQWCGEQDEQSVGPWNNCRSPRPVPHSHPGRLPVWDRVSHPEAAQLSLPELPPSEDRVSCYQAGGDVGTERRQQPRLVLHQVSSSDCELINCQFL